MSLELYSGALGVFEFPVDDPTTVGTDDFSTVTWLFRILGASGETVEFDATYASNVVTVEVSAVESADFAPGLYFWYLIATQTTVDDIVAGEGVLRVKSFPIEAVEVS